MNAWELIDGDNTLLTTFNLNEESIVIDVGGYMGDWSAKIIEKYNPYITIYEPINKFYKAILDRFKDNDKITVINKAVWSNKGYLTFGINKSDSGIYCFGEKERVEATDIISEMDNYKHIDLIKINIESSEYEVIDRITSYMSNANKVSNFLIQFHDYISNHKEKIKILHNRLEKTHELIFNFPYIWEHWRIKQ